MDFPVDAEGWDHLCPSHGAHCVQRAWITLESHGSISSPWDDLSQVWVWVRIWVICCQPPARACCGAGAGQVRAHISIPVSLAVIDRRALCGPWALGWLWLVL